MTSRPTRAALLVAAVLGLSVVPALDARAEIAHVPGAAAHAHVFAGRVHRGVDFALPRAAAISGRITRRGDRGVYNAVVRFFTASGRAVATTRTDGRGHFHAIGLPPAETGYYVCANHHDDASVARQAAGNLGRCLGSAVRYGGRHPTTGAQLVAARAGVVTRGVTFRLPPGGAISGALRSADTGHDLGGLVAVLFDSTGKRLRAHQADGPYQFSGLPAGDYRVCFDATGRTTGGVYDSQTGWYGTGFLDRCYGGVRWDGGAAPAGARTIHVRIGKHLRGLGTSFRVAGAVTGAVTAVTAPHSAIEHALVRIYRHGLQIAEVRTGREGRYRIIALPPADDYRVCTVSGRVTGLPYRYDIGQCVANVSVSTRGTHDGVDLSEQHSPQHFGARAGTVRDMAGTELNGVYVDVYDANHRHRATTTTAADGSYVVRALPVGRYLVCFNQTAGGEPSRYAAACFGGRPWNQVDLPSHGDLVTVRAGRLHRDVDTSLPVGGTITGHVRAGSHPLAETTVWLISAHHRVIDWRWTDQAGNYHFIGLAGVARGYHVCVSAPAFGGTGSAGTGLSGQCLRGSLWRRPLDPVSR
ncbi:MAG TPA: carboxypeptidase regulatory-like domain-containing protein [Jatrophihabitans sp.]|jgi:hypothetical protein